MRWKQLFYRDLVRHRRRFLGVATAVASSVAVAVLLGAFGAGVYRYVVQPLLPRLPLDLLKVEPKTVSLGVFAFDASRLGGSGLDKRMIDDLRQLDGVREVYPVTGVRVPLRAEGGEGFIGRRLFTDVFATGVPLELVKDELLAESSFKDPPSGKPIPVVVARRLLELYNTTVAPALDKPRLSEKVAIGFEFILHIGRSHTGGTIKQGRVRKMPAKIVGFSDRASLAGITIPEETAQRLNEEFEMPSPVTEAWVETLDAEYAGQVAERIEQRGLRIDDSAKLISAGLLIAKIMLGSLGGLLLCFSAWAIAQVFFLMLVERRTELAILRALGARTADLCGLVLMEAATIGVGGSLVGIGLGSGVALILDGRLRSTLPHLPFQPEALVDFPPEVFVIGLTVGVGAAVLGALVPAFMAGRTDPGMALRS